MQPNIAGHPWLSEKRARFNYLTQLLTTSNKIDSLNDKYEFNQIHTTSAVTSSEDTRPTQEVLSICKALLKDPGQSIPFVEFKYTRSELDMTQIKNEILGSRELVEESMVETILHSLFTRLLSLSELDTSGEVIALQVLSQILLELHARRSVKPLPSNLLLCVQQMIAAAHLRNFVLEQLLPAILLSPGHRQCGFVMNLYRTLSPEFRITLLQVLCSAGTTWPAESFPIIQSLLTEHTGRWSAVLYALVCNAFVKQAKLNPNVHKSPQFANLLIQFIKQHGSELSDNQLWSALERLAEQQNTFLRTPLLNSIAAFQTGT